MDWSIASLAAWVLRAFEIVYVPPRMTGPLHVRVVPSLTRRFDYEKRERRKEKG
jgi:hypothetical protein